jgi:hypothetical protein
MTDDKLQMTNDRLRFANSNCLKISRSLMPEAGVIRRRQGYVGQGSEKPVLSKR